jgi:N-acyl-D-aspartate/D-glutamate deacylase
MRAPWIALALSLGSLFAAAQDFDLVILHGRVLDPETKLDAVRHVGVRGGVIRAVSARPLRGKITLDARGLAVAPGFIDLHSHGQDAENYRAKAMDGVTTALEMEVGVGDIDRWYGEREGKALIHYGAAIGHIPVRMALMGDPGGLLPSGPAAQRAASDAQVAEMKRQIRRGLERGAPGVGFGVMYVPSASHWEILEMFRAAAEFRAPAYVHIRHGGPVEPGGVLGLEEVLAASVVSGTPLHVVHINSMGGDAAGQMLQMIGEARQRGLDVTTETYPYTASMTDISSAIYNDGWQRRLDIDFKDLQWAATGERLTAESFARYRKQGGMVIAHGMKEELIRMVVGHPQVMIASDGILQGGKGHPRCCGTFARVLGRYVRDGQALSLLDAVAKMSLLPARRLEGRVPEMKNKGRLRPGASADLVVFDPATVADQATFEQPGLYSKGIHHVLVNGTLVVRDGKLLDGALPGRAVRAPIRP